MPRQLKVYRTSIGFFELAIAAPSMKAALVAWGANSNLFRQGFAKEVDDASTVAAAMAKPGVVLRRAVGTDKPFVEDADLPKASALAAKTTPKRTHAPAPKQTARKADDHADRRAILAFEKQEARRERQRLKDEATHRKRERSRVAAIEKVERAREQARRKHEAINETLAEARARLDERIEAEETRWQREREELDERLRKARQ